jgi:hypothetical protein
MTMSELVEEAVRLWVWTASDDQERWRLCFFSNTDTDVFRLDIGVVS